MGKIQSIKRTNGSVTHHLNIPKEVMEGKGWEKGDMIGFLIDRNGDVLLVKER